MADRLGLGVIEPAHLFIDPAHLVERVDAERDMADAAARAFRPSVGISTIFWWCSSGLWLMKIGSAPLRPGRG